jgi:hypothetical protein
MKPWEHGDGGHYMIEPEDSFKLEDLESEDANKSWNWGPHAESSMDPDRLIAEFSKSMNGILDSFRSGKIEKSEALSRADSAISVHVERLLESARLRLGRKLQRKIDSLPSELVSRIRRQAHEYREDFAIILNDAGS